MGDDGRRLAIIKGVKCGVGDRGRFALWFSVYISECEAALQVFENPGDIAALMKSFGVGDVQQLNGKPCWVDTSDRGTIRWIGAAKI